MSIPVPIAELAAQLDHRTSGFVITTSPDGRPHAAHQPVVWNEEKGTITFPAGKSTRGNADTNPLICVLFAAAGGSSDGYSLIIDATVEPNQPSDQDLDAVPTHAVLHRPAPPQH